ncbi:collagen alpha-1(I) chain-like [Neopelma chrysocephalum]|uniref:collagen alpha-1(I) chain-like n=1 Tax=Neopelma chrysocephalum TaxID=114329 RepID=UPI000FCD3F69|nr:collagen alpha-1(I) chain-like [Neopelma chrysocephalum]
MCREGGVWGRWGVAGRGGCGAKGGAGRGGGCREVGVRGGEGGVRGVRRCGRRAPALLSERNVRRLHHCGGTAGGGGSAQQRPRRRAPGTVGTEPPLPARRCPPLPAPAEGHRGDRGQPPAACAARRGCCISPAPSRGPRPGAAGGAGGGGEGAPPERQRRYCRLPRPPVPAEHPEEPGAASPASVPGALPAPPRRRPERAAGPGGAGRGAARPAGTVRVEPRLGPAGIPGEPRLAGAAPHPSAFQITSAARACGPAPGTEGGLAAESRPPPGASAASKKLS